MIRIFVAEVATDVLKEDFKAAVLVDSASIAAHVGHFAKVEVNHLVFVGEFFLFHVYRLPENGQTARIIFGF